MNIVGFFNFAKNNNLQNHLLHHTDLCALKLQSLT